MKQNKKAESIKKCFVRGFAINCPTDFLDMSITYAQAHSILSLKVSSDRRLSDTDKSFNHPGTLILILNEFICNLLGQSFTTFFSFSIDNIGV